MQYDVELYTRDLVQDCRILSCHKNIERDIEIGCPMYA